MHLVRQLPFGTNSGRKSPAFQTGRPPLLCRSGGGPVVRAERCVFQSPIHWGDPVHASPMRINARMASFLDFKSGGCEVSGRLQLCAIRVCTNPCRTGSRGIGRPWPGDPARLNSRAIRARYSASVVRPLCAVQIWGKDPNTTGESACSTTASCVLAMVGAG